MFAWFPLLLSILLHGTLESPPSGLKEPFLLFCALENVVRDEVAMVKMFVTARGQPDRRVAANWDRAGRS